MARERDDDDDGLCVCQDETARRDATIVTVIAAVRVAILVVLIATGQFKFP